MSFPFSSSIGFPVIVHFFLAIGVAVGLYFLLRPHFGTETLSWMCILGDAPFAVMGFVKYNGMTAEQFVWAWVKSEILNALDSGATTKVTINNRRLNRSDFEQTILIRGFPVEKKFF
jgi:hypothetical protein